MIICQCNVLTDKHIGQALASGAARPRDVYEACGARAQCGICTKSILRMVRAAAADRPGFESGD